MSHNTFKISKYDLSKKSMAELNHYAQLINIDIVNYKNTIKNYPKNRMDKCGIPFLKTLTDTLSVVENEIKNNTVE